jgi:hypothetical protein
MQIVIMETHTRGSFLKIEIIDVIIIIKHGIEINILGVKSATKIEQIAIIWNVAEVLSLLGTKFGRACVFT